MLAQKSASSTVHANGFNAREPDTRITVRKLVPRPPAADQFDYLPPPVMTLPGSAVGAGGALTEGVKELAPPGVMAFSVGDGAGALELVGLVLEGASLVSLPQAVRLPIPMIATPPAKSAICRVKRADLILESSLCAPETRKLAGPAVTNPPQKGGDFLIYPKTAANARCFAYSKMVRGKSQRGTAQIPATGAKNGRWTVAVNAGREMPIATEL